MCGTGNKTKHQPCTLNGKILQVLGEQKDLGVTVCNNLKPISHIKHITTKANQRIALIKRCFESRTENIIKNIIRFYNYANAGVCVTSLEPLLAKRYQ